MKVTRNTTHNLRHDWLHAEDERGKVKVSLLACRNEIHVAVKIDGKETVDYFTLRQLAQAVANASTDLHETP